MYYLHGQTVAILSASFGLMQCEADGSSTQIALSRLLVIQKGHLGSKGKMRQQKLKVQTLRKTSFFGLQNMAFLLVGRNLQLHGTDQFLSQLDSQHLSLVTHYVCQLCLSLLTKNLAGFNSHGCLTLSPKQTWSAVRWAYFQS